MSFVLAFMLAFTNPSGAVIKPTGRASWYGHRCPEGVTYLNRRDTCTPYRSKATGGRGGELTWYAAVPGFRYSEKPFQVDVCARGTTKCVRVWVRDFCGCNGSRRKGDEPIIDLSPTAFARLAPLSRGVIYVDVRRVPPAPGK
ncbi:RlpA-like protein, double-psi beta-barrel domain containing protein [uncultured Caudovirales phage]|uniref:RlpA-like protein, double-psi beta-barrel domain containing protein n=1 Tax=uncultured Caudovirales phage TaxID=2100421 RepID=A0A6J5N1V6_9CAUD|nr:RlpA-like protein, double-psi beta-barrel domain containing protein [uncultured Caudovirales phage]